MLRNGVFFSNQGFVPLILSLILIIPGTSMLVGEAVAEERKYDVDSDQERIVVPYGEYRSLEYDFQKGKRLEIIFTIQTSNKIPIDFWFINDEQYLLLEAGGQFLFFIDGTGQQLTYARRIVELTEHDVYNLVITNYYSNQTSVTVDITFETRLYNDESIDENGVDSLLKSPTFLGHLVLTIIMIITILFFLKSRKAILYQTLAAQKKRKKTVPTKKKGEKSTPAKTKSKKATPGKKKRKKKELEKNSDSKAKFCGNCGAKVTKKFCTDCGEKV